MIMMQFDYHMLRRIFRTFFGTNLARVASCLFFGEAIFGAQRGIL